MDPVIQFIYMWALTKQETYVEGDQHSLNVRKLKDAIYEDERAVWTPVGGTSASVKEANDFLRKYLC